MHESSQPRFENRRTTNALTVGVLRTILNVIPSDFDHLPIRDADNNQVEVLADTDYLCPEVQLNPPCIRLKLS